MGTVVGSWRLKYMIVIFVFLTSIYTSYIFLGNIDKPAENMDYVTYEDSISQINYNDTSRALKKTNDFWSVFGTLIGLITFSSIDNFYARLFLSLVMSILWIAVGYILYTYIKEWIPLT